VQQSYYQLPDSNSRLLAFLVGYPYYLLVEQLEMIDPYYLQPSTREKPGSIKQEKKERDF